MAESEGVQGSDNWGILQWWEMLVKPGIKRLGIQRSKELGKAKREELNLLLLRQRYLKIKMLTGEHHHLKELKLVHLLIENGILEKVKRFSTRAKSKNSKAMRDVLSTIMNYIRKG